jgi:hypothetical protein
MNDEVRSLCRDAVAPFCQLSIVIWSVAVLYAVDLIIRQTQFPSIHLLCCKSTDLSASFMDHWDPWFSSALCLSTIQIWNMARINLLFVAYSKVCEQLRAEEPSLVSPPAQKQPTSGWGNKLRTSLTVSRSMHYNRRCNTGLIKIGSHKTQNRNTTQHKIINHKS